MLITLVTVVHVFASLLLIGIVLLQQGKGADMGATFGGGGGTVFGAGGADNLLTRVTTTLAVGFMITSIFLARSGSVVVTTDEGTLFQGQTETAPVTAPATDGAAPAGETTDSNTEAATTDTTAAATVDSEATPAADAAPVAEDTATTTSEAAPAPAAPTTEETSEAPPAAE